jgi:hypothetical protein
MAEGLPWRMPCAECKYSWQQHCCCSAWQLTGRGLDVWRQVIATGRRGTNGLPLAGQARDRAAGHEPGLPQPPSYKRVHK